MTLVDYSTMKGTAQRSSTFLFEVMTMDLLPIGILDVNLDRPPVLNNNINRTIKRSISNLTFPMHQAVDVDMLMDHIRVSMIHSDGVFPIGVFMFADPSVARSTGGDWVDATLVDQGLMLDQAIEVGFAMAPGSLITPAIEERLMSRMIHDFEVEASGRTTGSDWISWPIGTTDLTIINDLCALLGFYSVYFDNAGKGIARSVPNLAVTDPDFIYGLGTSVITDSIIESNDLLSAPNRYIVVNNGMSDAPVSGFWDVPDSAPHSFANRGMHVARVIDSQSVSDNEQAAAMAQALGQSDTSTYEWASFNTAINPLHDTFNVVQWDGKKYHEQEWSFTLQDGADQRHGLRRVYG